MAQFSLFPETFPKVKILPTWAKRAQSYRLRPSTHMASPKNEKRPNGYKYVNVEDTIHFTKPGLTEMHTVVSCFVNNG
jgi:hypothetical protein